MKNTLEQLLSEKHLKTRGSFKVGHYIVTPIYWSEDKKENINYDIESIREEFENVLYELEEHNETSEFYWD